MIFFSFSNIVIIIIIFLKMIFLFLDYNLNPSNGLNEKQKMIYDKLFYHLIILFFFKYERIVLNI